MGLAPFPQKPARQCLRLSDIDWQTYSRLLYTFAERHDVRLAYDRGQMELMSPVRLYIGEAQVLSSLVLVLAEELGLPLKGAGSTTLRRRRLHCGVGPDASFWIANAHRMASRRHLDLRTDPPPGLAIDVTVKHGSLDRMAIYARLRVPEVWKLEADTLSFHVWGPDGTYANAARSLAFPLVTPADLLGFHQQARLAGDQNVVLRQFRSWIQLRLASGK
jgi:Uma2 family endonuclease